jgi:hypothetical protein
VLVWDGDGEEVYQCLRGGHDDLSVNSGRHFLFSLLSSFCCICRLLCYISSRLTLPFPSIPYRPYSSRSHHLPLGPCSHFPFCMRSSEAHRLFVPCYRIHLFAHTQRSFAHESLHGGRNDVTFCSCLCLAWASLVLLLVSFDDRPAAAALSSLGTRLFASRSTLDCFLFGSLDGSLHTNAHLIVERSRCLPLGPSLSLQKVSLAFSFLSYVR